jgi:hypothetical protein
MLHLHCFRNPSLDFEVGSEETGICSTHRIFEDTCSSRVYEQVLRSW